MASWRLFEDQGAALEEFFNLFTGFELNDAVVVDGVNQGHAFNSMSLGGAVG